MTNATKYDHAFSLGFSVVSNREDAADVTHEMLMEGVLRRLHGLTVANQQDGESLVGACDAPFDTMEAMRPERYELTEKG
jgi:hypothetical protein